MNRRATARYALALTAAIALAACGGELAATPATTPAGATAPADDPTATEPTDADADAEDDTAATDPEAGGSDDATTDQAAVEVKPEGQELLLVGASEATVLATLPDEGESVFRAAAVRPGSTPDDLTVVVVTSAEGMYDLRWLTVVDGTAGELRTFPDRYQLDPARITADDAVPTPVWSPDGRTIAWLVPDEDGATLQTVGWADGPGTGETADDNAAFALESVPATAQARSWAEAGDGTLVLRAEAADGTAHDVVLTRQADGALALDRVEAVTR